MLKSNHTESEKNNIQSKRVNLADLYPLIQEVLDNGGTFSLTITGSSMFPTILGGRDQVSIVKPSGPLKKYDLPFYRRTNGQFVLHRIVDVQEDGTYTCCGDHQWLLEPGIRHEQVIGVVTDYVRKGKAFRDDNKSYRRYVKFWVWFLKGRPFAFGAYKIYQKVKHFLRFKVFGIFYRN